MMSFQVFIFVALLYLFCFIGESLEKVTVEGPEKITNPILHIALFFKISFKGKNLAVVNINDINKPNETVLYESSNEGVIWEQTNAYLDKGSINSALDIYTHTSDSSGNLIVIHKDNNERVYRTFFNATKEEKAKTEPLNMYPSYWNPVAISGKAVDFSGNEKAHNVVCTSPWIQNANIQPAVECIVSQSNTSGWSDQYLFYLNNLSTSNIIVRDMFYFNGYYYIKLRETCATPQVSYFICSKKKGMTFYCDPIEFITSVGYRVSSVDAINGYLIFLLENTEKNEQSIAVSYEGDVVEPIKDIPGFSIYHMHIISVNDENATIIYDGGFEVNAYKLKGMKKRKVGCEIVEPVTNAPGKSTNNLEYTHPFIDYISIGDNASNKVLQCKVNYIESKPSDNSGQNTFFVKVPKDTNFEKTTCFPFSELGKTYNDNLKNVIITEKDITNSGSKVVDKEVTFQLPTSFNNHHYKENTPACVSDNKKYIIYFTFNNLFNTIYVDNTQKPSQYTGNATPVRKFIINPNDVIYFSKKCTYKIKTAYVDSGHVRGSSSSSSGSGSGAQNRSLKKHLIPEGTYQMPSPKDDVIVLKLPSYFGDKPYILEINKQCGTNYKEQLHFYYNSHAGEKKNDAKREGINLTTKFSDLYKYSLADVKENNTVSIEVNNYQNHNAFKIVSPLNTENELNCTKFPYNEEDVPLVELDEQKTFQFISIFKRKLYSGSPEEIDPSKVTDIIEGISPYTKDQIEKAKIGEPGLYEYQLHLNPNKLNDLFLTHGYGSIRLKCKCHVSPKDIHINIDLKQPSYIPRDPIITQTDISADSTHFIQTPDSEDVIQQGAHENQGTQNLSGSASNNGNKNLNQDSQRKAQKNASNSHTSFFSLFNLFCLFVYLSN